MTGEATSGIGFRVPAGYGSALPEEAGLRLRRWFAVYTLPRHEKRVRELMERRGIECYLPLYPVVRRWKNGCVMHLELPLFPGYLFVRIAAAERTPVLEIAGVCWIVGRGREPLPLPEADVERLRSGLQQRKAEPCPYLAVGERARIETGALAGMEGILLRRKKDLRVVLTLDLISQSIAVEVDMADVRPLGSARQQTAA